MKYKIVEQSDGTHRLLRDDSILYRFIDTEKTKNGRPTLAELEFWFEIKRLRADLATQQKEEQMSGVEQVREQIIAHQEQRRRIRELKDRQLTKEKAMVIWVKKEAVCASCNQRATVEGTIIIDERYKKVGVRVNLLGTGEYFNVKLDDIVGVELTEEIILQFSCVGHIIKEEK